MWFKRAYTPVMITAPKDLRLQTEADLKTYLEAIGEPAFRAKQIHQWLWQKNVDDIGQMSNLSKELRARLEQDFYLRKLAIAEQKQSADGTIKYGFSLPDGHLVEGVLIPTDTRVTACISSQVGCSLTCKFCATGYMKMERNLHAYEIFEQVDILRKEALAHYNRPLTNVVYMGMGEPLLNYKNVLASIEKLTSPEGLGMSTSRITVSTAGIAKMIKKLGDDNFKCEFALSLHAANDQKRNQIMPINESNSLEALREALQYFYQKTRTRVTYEYICFSNFNDELQDAAELYEFTKVVPCKVNIIEYNPIGEASFRFTSYDKLDRFRAYLEERGVIVNVRRSRGRDVDGACGQLAIKQKQTA
jgi:23S rRNA (adenine2503-C2)-methyltransferase